jgi:hypothetical protein
MPITSLSLIKNIKIMVLLNLNILFCGMMILDFRKDEFI